MSAKQAHVGFEVIIDRFCARVTVGMSIPALEHKNVITKKEPLKHKNCHEFSLRKTIRLTISPNQKFIISITINILRNRIVITKMNI